LYGKKNLSDNILKTSLTITHSINNVEIRQMTQRRNVLVIMGSFKTTHPKSNAIIPTSITTSFNPIQRAPTNQLDSVNSFQAQEDLLSYCRYPLVSKRPPQTIKFNDGVFNPHFI